MDNLKKSNELLEAIVDGTAFDKETGLIWEHWVNAIIKQVDLNNIKLRVEENSSNESAALPLHDVSDCFSFARYLNENFHYFDNTDVGDVYKDNDGQGLYSEKDIYDEWLNNR